MFEIYLKKKIQILTSAFQISPGCDLHIYVRGLKIASPFNRVSGSQNTKTVQSKWSSQEKR